MSEVKTGPISKRPMSAVTRLTSNSRISNVPDIGRMKIMLIANDLHKNRSAISESVMNNKGSLRDMFSSSEIQTILKKIGIFIEIGHLKAVLKELGFNWNGKSCTFLALF